MVGFRGRPGGSGARVVVVVGREPGGGGGGSHFQTFYPDVWARVSETHPLWFNGTNNTIDP